MEGPEHRAIILLEKFSKRLANNFVSRINTPHNARRPVPGVLFETETTPTRFPVFMAKILLIISALVIAATAYLGFATKQKVDGLQEDFKKNKTTLNAAQADLTKTKTTLKATEEKLLAANVTIEERDKDIAQRKGDLDKATADVTKLTADLAAKTDELEKIKIKLGGEKPINVDEMVAEVARLKEEIKTLTNDLAEKTQLVDTLNTQKKESDAKLQQSEQTVQAYKHEITRPGLSGTILAYNPGWNFVVLSIGDKHGLKANARLVVRRGGQMIGKVKVTSVEPSTSIADIVPGSVPKGSSVQPGDSVIFEGRNQ
jgi:peptidoglycan hydrolase CwlO-like protein